MTFHTKLCLLDLCIRFDEVSGFIRVYDGIKNSVLLGSGKYHVIYNRIRYHMRQKVVSHRFFSHNYTKIKLDSYDFLLLEKTLTLHNVIIIIKSFLHEDKNPHYYNIFLEKCPYK